MNPKKITFTHKAGTVEGIYINAGPNSSLVIIINGHNGFYNYGLFPYLQNSLASDGISSYSFNFSHGGILGDSDYFEDLDGYQKNCMRMEVEDVMSILRHLHDNLDGNHSRCFLLAHSLGGVPLVFSAAKAQDEDISIAGLILVSTVKKLNFWPREMVDEWKENKVYFKKNNRTGQMLPQGVEFLSEVLQSDGKWNVQHEITTLKQPVLILHGENDEAVPEEHGRSLFAWIHPLNKRSYLKIIPGATHTYNTKHPFEGPTPQLEDMINAVKLFIRSTTEG
jgi:uncharacterized protein